MGNSPSQRKIIEASTSDHLLVLAPPGSGKTRTIAERVAFLLEHAIAAPEQVVAMTFTERAAAELTDRLQVLGQPGVTSGTFHRFCAQLLHRDGSEIGLTTPQRVCDDRQQQELMKEAVAEVIHRRVDESTLRKLRFCISHRKCANLSYEVAAMESPLSIDNTRAIDNVYCRMLREIGGLDFDDLIVEASRMLWDAPNVAERVHQRYRFVFVDEFHDVSPEQYRLLYALVPPSKSDRQLVVVADPNQAIFGFRHADAPLMLAQFRKHYRPIQHRLVENYRSPGNIVRAARSVIGERGAHLAGQPVIEDSHAITVITCPTVDAESERLINLIERARAAGYSYGDIAILYSKHKRADATEVALLRAGVPVRRLRPGRFFDEPEVQEALRYLELVASLHDGSFVPALNWPRVLVDELTMIHLRRRAVAEGMTLAQLASRADILSESCTPLTRAAIDAFRETIAAELVPVADEPLPVVVQSMLTCLGRRRDPIPDADRAALRDSLDFIGTSLLAFADKLYQAICERKSIAISTANNKDCVIGEMILRGVLARYLPHSLCTDAESGQRFTVTLSDQPSGCGDIVISPRPTRTVFLTVSTQIWRLCQMVLMRFEQLGKDRFVVYDLETGSNNANSAEVVEIGARIVDGGNVTGDVFNELVRPSGERAISRDATAVHGIEWVDVEDAASGEEVLTRFSTFVGDAILAGHYIEGFDQLVLRRTMSACGLSLLSNFTLDTCKLAQRIMPHEPHDLASLARIFNVSTTPNHRALPDATANAEIMLGLFERLNREREIHILLEWLPLVALGIRAQNVTIDVDNALLVRLGARVAALGQSDEGLMRYRERFPDDAEAASFLSSENPQAVPDDLDWNRLGDRWNTMVDDYCHGSSDCSLPGFLHYAALAKEVDYSPDASDQGRVTMLTVHSAKGKEWPVVFIIGAEDGLFPFSNQDEDEGRRVFYVAMTRPKKRLVVMWAERVDDRRTRPSRYLADIPEDLICWR